MIKKIQEHIVLALVVVGIAMYISVLSLAMVTDPEFMPVNSDSIVGYSDFSVDTEAGSKVTQEALIFSAEQQETVFSAVLPLIDREEITVEFKTDIAEQYAGTVLYVDLFGENYDSPEQEFTVRLQPGKHEVSKVIRLGTNVPQEVQLRIFSLNPVQLAVSDLSVSIMVPAERPIAVIIALICAILSSVAFLCLLGYKFIRKNRSTCNP